MIEKKTHTDNMEKKRILFIPISMSGGVWYYRAYTPMKAIADRYADEFDITIDNHYTFTDAEKDEIGKSYDIVWMHNCIYPGEIQEEVWKMIIYCKKEYGVKFILDIDDYWDYGRWHPAREACKFNAIPEKMLINFQLFDYVTTTTEYFKGIISNFFHKEKIMVFENAISKEDHQFSLEKNHSDKIRIGFTGGSSHTYDMEGIMGFWKWLPRNIKEQIEVVLCGYDTKCAKKVTIDENGKVVEERDLKDHENWWITTENEIIKGVGKDHYKRIESKDISKGEFGQIYKDIDILLVPLKNTRFNNCKSELKFIEAGFTGTAVIASKVIPYSNFAQDGVDCMLVKENIPQKWAKKIKQLVLDKELIKSVAEANSKRVTEERNLEKITEKRVEFLRTLD